MYMHFINRLLVGNDENCTYFFSAIHYIQSFYFCEYKREKAILQLHFISENQCSTGIKNADLISLCLNFIIHKIEMLILTPHNLVIRIKSITIHKVLSP